MGALDSDLDQNGLGILTCGITLGSWWAYYELGWGGWWFGIQWKTLLYALAGGHCSRALTVGNREPRHV